MSDTGLFRQKGENGDPLCQHLLGKLLSLEAEVCTEGMMPNGGNAAERTK